MFLSYTIKMGSTSCDHDALARSVGALYRMPWHGSHWSTGHTLSVQHECGGVSDGSFDCLVSV